VVLDALPLLVALEDVGVFLDERLARHGLLDQFGDLGLVGQMSLR
jgi:UDP-3-O-acyl-N-acetylglucosamine deacetylase